MKKIVIATTVSFLLVAGVVYANEEKEIVSPESELYETVRIIEETTIELTKDTGEKTLLEDQYAEQRLLEAEEMFAVGNEEAGEKSLEDYSEHIEKIERNITKAKDSGKDLSEVESIVYENMEKRSENLVALLEQEDLPDQAKAGITKALANKEKAKQRAEEARNRAGAGRDNNNGGNAQGKAEQAKQKGQERAEQARQQGRDRAEQGKGNGNKPENAGRP
ncbi:DUF5667 domain-containing protein [Halalkalibacter alkaliphilus]|uniref:DUF5667 domain-containing protein n=1 Tax=Halalkalibacter alkaliphilus TaxID=2917993 RepID=A0A9X2CTF0_9BACI|nr:DUF5667 domain-containing protein [Halalkalibacter alkaliphilus]MCL7748001.1 DUF5667 domain-containing protein [Halalkalibacter alkaliphilus]